MYGEGRKSGNRVCGAKTRKGRPCQNAPVLGRNRCRMHGGASLRGAAHPNFKHGRRSKAPVHDHDPEASGFRIVGYGRLRVPQRCEIRVRIVVHDGAPRIQ